MSDFDNLPADQQNELDDLLSNVRAAQQVYWNALSRLEETAGEYGIVLELDSSQDFEHANIEDLLDESEGGTQ